MCMDRYNLLCKAISNFKENFPRINEQIFSLFLEFIYNIHNIYYVKMNVKKG